MPSENRYKPLNVAVEKIADGLNPRIREHLLTFLSDAGHLAYRKRAQELLALFGGDNRDACGLLKIRSYLCDNLRFADSDRACQPLMAFDAALNLLRNDFRGVKTVLAEEKISLVEPVFAAEIDWPALLDLVRRDKIGFSELPKFPAVRRDLALLLDEKVSYADLRAAAFKQAKKLLRQVGLFDVYRGDKIPAGKKQYALSFVLQDPERTLTDAEVENAMGKILAAFQNQFGATLR